MKIRRLAATLLRVVPAILALGVVAAWQVDYDLREPYRSYDGVEREVDIPSGSTGTEVLHRLAAEGIVPSPLALRVYLRWTGKAKDLRAGEFLFQQALSPLEVLDKILRGDVLLHRVTVPEGLDVEQIASILSSTGFWQEADVLEALADTSVLSDLSPGTSSLEGFLFPETYSFPRSTTAQQLVQSMVERFGSQFDPALRELAEDMGLSVLEVVTVASLIEDEVRVPEEAPLVSSVIHNRLARGMRLEIDASVIYALKRAGQYTPPLLRRDLAYDSPWNTYLNAGIPPGPISSPGRVALEAVVRPAETEYLYYVLKPDGSGQHAFSRSYREHQAAVRLWRARRK